MRFKAWVLLCFAASLLLRAAADLFSLLGVKTPFGRLSIQIAQRTYEEIQKNPIIVAKDSLV